MLEEKIERVYDILRDKTVVVAFSGGVDSSTIALLAKDVAKKVLAITANSQTVPLGEIEDAKRIAEEMGITHIIIEVDELAHPEFAKNPENRCYYCKKALFEVLSEFRAQEGADLIIDGTNASELKEHRPGYVALKELGIRSPLAEAGITKPEIRQIAQSRGFSFANKPPLACLSSRIPYGQIITEEKIFRVGKAEKFVREVLKDVRVLRVRDYDDFAKIEIGHNEFDKLFDNETINKIVTHLKDLGYKHVYLDLEGYKPMVPQKWKQK
ncbi:ATP-dependent sacrificial sulfur transferase LarE [Candidatus Borrarchaeum sp.]|uniref:ATP-dependent sacrificial sulfur transferase LarE n=1 Tax=Candidatus Borrarchaeum sp. TaxID=2846742 RepID=UPI0025801601|nr:ATP-dependent sacrificial sulfur transferase LarE [Candidatus Borrarchaeum sp.]